MSVKYWMPTEESKQADWMDHYGARISIHGPTLNMTLAQIADTQTRCAFGSAAIRLRADIAKYAQELTKFKTSVLWGDEPTPAWPVGFTMPTDLPPVTSAGVLAWLSLQVGKLKRETTYTTAIGTDLWVEGAEQVLPSAAEADALKPVLKYRIATGGHPLLVWVKRGMKLVTAIEFWVDRGDGKGSVFLAIDSVPDYLDTYQLPAAGTSAVWKYKAIYKQGDNPVGQWSDILNVSVMGV